MGELMFYLAHYYDKNKKQFIPFLYTNIAQNVLLDAESEETVADALTQLQSAKIYTLSELLTHTGNAGIHVSNGQMQAMTATVNSLITHADSTGIHVSQADKAACNATTATANEARTLAAGAAEKVTEYESRITRLEDGLFSNITGNPFLITFDALSGLTITRGVWNREKQCIEC